VVVLGRAEERAVHLNQRETYLFTDYVVEVEQWLRPEQGAPSLKVSIEGGRVTIAGRDTWTGGAPLDTTKRHILFLDHVPGSGSLTPTRPALTDGKRWTATIPNITAIPEFSNRTVPFDIFAEDIARLGRTCAGRGR